MPCGPGAQYSLPIAGLWDTSHLSIGSGGHPCSHHLRKENSGGTRPGRAQRRAWSIGRRAAERTLTGAQRASLGAECARPDAPRPPREEPQGCATGRRAPGFSGASSAASDSFLESHPAPRTPGDALGRPHLANRTVPCSSGAAAHRPPALPGSARAWHACSPRGRGAQGWDPRGAGTVTARAAISAETRLTPAPPTGPRSLGRGAAGDGESADGPATAPSRPGGGAPAGPALPGNPAPAVVPAPRPRRPPGAFKAAAPRPSVRVDTHLRATDSGRDLAAWERTGLQSFTEIAEPLGNSVSHPVTILPLTS